MIFEIIIAHHQFLGQFIICLNDYKTFYMNKLLIK
jgi:hypothetical protein